MFGVYRLESLIKLNMAEASSLIPKAGQIEVPNPPDITGAQFLKQVIEYVNLQIAPLDEEVSKASSGDNGLVSSVVAMLCTLHVSISI